MKKIDIAIADDHTLIIDGLKNTLQKFDKIGNIRSATNGKELLDLLRSYTPQVILLDINMPVMGGIEACEKISNKYPLIKILALTQYSDELAINHMISVGAHGYLVKDTNPEELYHAINEVVEKDFYYNDLSYKAMVVGKRRDYNRSNYLPEVEITEREKQILKYICLEKTCTEIGDILCISPRTVEFARGKLLKKIGAKSVVGLVKFAVEKGYHI
jgi:DNA-binding NarL/FixJ family response regulator